jgi:cell division protein FtsB
MDPAAVAEVVAPFLALVGIGSMVLVGMKMRYTHLQRTRSAAAAPEEVERLTEAVETLRDDVRILRDEVVDLSERVDFTERVLTRGKSVDAGFDALPRPKD